MNLKQFSALEIVIIIVMILLICFLPYCLSQYSPHSPFNEGSSWVGSAIGGITAPVVGLLGAVLLYITIKLQIQANRDNHKRQQEQDDSAVLGFYYNSLKSSIDSYSYRSIKGSKSTGSEAVYNILNDVYCSPHDYQDQINNKPRLTELKSILELFGIVLLKIKDSSAPDKEAVLELTKHQFNYRVFPRLNEPEIIEGRFCKVFCEDCKKDHGLPDEFITLIENIQSKIVTLTNEKTH